MTRFDSRSAVGSLSRPVRVACCVETVSCCGGAGFVFAGAGSGRGALSGTGCSGRHTLVSGRCRIFPLDLFDQSGDLLLQRSAVSIPGRNRPRPAPAQAAGIRRLSHALPVERSPPSASEPKDYPSSGGGLQRVAQGRGRASIHSQTFGTNPPSLQRAAALQRLAPSSGTRIVSLEAVSVEVDPSR